MGRRFGLGAGERDRRIGQMADALIGQSVGQSVGF
jgi:hypothetical protein